MKRRFVAVFALAVPLTLCSGWQPSPPPVPTWAQKVMDFRKRVILQKAVWAMRQSPQTIADFPSPRTAGDRHDFYSEGDYWWPDPAHPGGPYIRRDGETNPENFVAHRHAMIRFSRIMGDLAAAYVLTRDPRYAEKALAHARAWFVDTATFMRPHLRFAQAIHGITPGRGIGIIDTIHLMEVAQAIYLFEQAGLIPEGALQAIRNWFAEYLRWLMQSKNGQDEMKAKNNHGTCWVMQVASFAKVTGDSSIMAFCRERYQSVLLPSQMSAQGSFPLELSRTKPYGYSLFNLDAMATICQILSDSSHDLWSYTTPDGRSIGLGLRFMYPFMADKRSWHRPPDVMYWSAWPVAQPCLVFGAAAFEDQAYFDLWKRLPHDPQTDEVIRNLPIRHPLIWMVSPPAP